MRHWSEEAALRFLEAHGYRLVAANAVVARIELDLVLRDDRGTLVVVEVRQRAHGSFGGPAESLTRTKLARVRRGALAWSARFRHRGDLRIDAVLLTGTRTRHTIEHLEDVA